MLEAADAGETVGLDGLIAFLKAQNCRAPSPQPCINPGFAESSKRVADVTAPLHPVKNVDRCRRPRCSASWELGGFSSNIPAVIL